ncbi:ABC transporter substrate-binding protein [Actimicrobium sp. CCC2.4]|uniref:ABC transporter substrate-binding protein n=1 Tax=Actimicrobium sp. CCC2.4 TaxID=3048606 RepID=UPI002AC8E0C4|nr:ABC transporter substrate-binding protein [Actimicrobium sp. CCC2.4]MEB0134722.1 ABC transporter substrate-binding protein [Actimicrobium sp. CCC2.4]WPX30663.1 ABC transporter substrate-binding protein [Actimicrobium sp. CCC2.4]
MTFSNFLVGCLRTALMTSALLWAGWVHAETVLRVLTWPGYADPDVVSAFEKKTGARLEVTFVNTDDELWSRLSTNNGGDFDVFAVNTAELQRYIDKGLSAPLDLASIPNQARQLPRFRDIAAIPGLMRGKRLYAIPFTYAEMGLIYNRKLVKQEPASMEAMWDPQYRGKVLAYSGSVHNFSVAAMLDGSKNPFRLSADELRAASRRLVGLRRNVLAFYSSPEEAVQLYLGNDVALVFANFGTQQLQALRAAGADVGYVVPKQGVLAWLDCWSVTGRARSPQLAAQWIDMTLQADVSARFSERHGLANTVTATSLSNASDKLTWLEPAEDADKRHALWTRILSGDVLQKF